VTPKAPAYRVRVDDRTWIVPDQAGEAGRAGHGLIGTGVAGCLDFAVATDKPPALDITPLFADGSEGSTRAPGCRTVPQTRRCRTAPDGTVSCVGGAKVQCSTGPPWSSVAASSSGEDQGNPSALRDGAGGVHWEEGVGSVCRQDRHAAYRTDYPPRDPSRLPRDR
jgi:hypothetical protein